MRSTLFAASLGLVLGASAFAQQPEKPISDADQKKRFPDSFFDEKRKGDKASQKKSFPDSVFDEKRKDDDGGQRRYPDSVFDEKRPDRDAQRQAPDPRYDRKSRSRELEQGRQIRDGHPERKMRDR